MPINADEAKKPNATTRQAIAELEAGKGKRYSSVDALFSDLLANAPGVTDDLRPAKAPKTAI